jgi:hypothetical protein
MKSLEENELNALIRITAKRIKIIRILLCSFFMEALTVEYFIIISKSHIAAFKLYYFSNYTTVHESIP